MCLCVFKMVSFSSTPYGCGAMGTDQFGHANGLTIESPADRVISIAL